MKVPLPLNNLESETKDKCKLNSNGNGRETLIVVLNQE